MRRSLPPPTDNSACLFSRRAALRSGAAACGLLLSGIGANTACAATQELLTPEAFGAKGDGRSDDTSAFLALSRHLNSHDGGVVSLRAGATYIVGRQTPGSDQFLVGEPILFAENVSRLEVRMNGATLRFKDGMKFGAFDPRTGAVRQAQLPHIVFGDRADIGFAIMARNVGFFSVSGGTIDCNSQKALIGGEWGDLGRQCTQYGVAAFSCGKVEWFDLDVSNSCLDGLVYGYPGIDGHAPARPLIVRNVVVDRVARNCLSLVGTNQALIEGCTFQRAGEAPNDRIGSLLSAPASCIDVEAEEAECRNVVIRNCNLLSGRYSYSAFVADSGPSSDILVDGCHLVGAVWTSKPRTIFKDCRINGRFARLYGGDRTASNNSIVSGCRVTDAPAFEALATKDPNVMDLEGAGPGVQVVDTVFDVAHTRLNLRGGILRNVTINFATGTNAIKNRDFAILADDAVLDGVVIAEKIPSDLGPADAFFVTVERSRVNALISPAGSKILWTSWSRAAGGHAGPYSSQ